MWTTSVPCLCVIFLRTCPHGSLFHRERGRRTPEVGTGEQCAMLSPLQRERCLVAGSHTSSRIDFVFPRKWLTHPCRKRRVSRWRLHVCVRSRASGQNSSTYRLLSTGLDFPEGFHAVRGDLSLSLPTHCSLSHLRIRHCVHLVGCQITLRTWCFHQSRRPYPLRRMEFDRVETVVRLT